MIDIEKVNTYIESHINNGSEWHTLACSSDPVEKFLVNSAKRLIVNYDLYRSNKNHYGDFLCSLRNYLLSSNTSLYIKDISNDHFTEFGLYIDELTKKVTASYSFPNYIDNDFSKLAFLSNYVYKETIDKESNLCTDLYIEKLTGYKSFRSESQKIAVYGALNTPPGYTTMISIPTGGGKSLVTQTVAYQTEGLTIVIVPTVSLSIDQERVSKLSVKREQISQEVFSYSSGVDPFPIIKAINSKTARLLFISPEALMMNSKFRNAIDEANKNRYLKNIVIDEAHIVADWGALFRIDYQCLESWRDELMVQNPIIRTFLLSATFERRCTDILKDLFSTAGKWIEIRCDELRREPRYMYVNATTLLDKRDKLLQIVRFLPHPVIVYVATPEDADGLLDLFSTAGFNNVKTFTGKTKNTLRKTLIDDWVDDKYEVIIATSAFGVGVNKSDIRTVVHAYIPQNANSYYQELGRAGRDKLPCLSVMCVQPELDEESAFSRISKKVMTTEKICRRWHAMYNNPKSVRTGNVATIDTSIKPSYRLKDVKEAEVDLYNQSNDTDINWNVYVLLFLRRHKLIDIDGVRVESGVYYFQISKINRTLLSKDEDDSSLYSLIEKFRTDEYNYYVQGLNEIREAIQDNKKQCWSEMFYKVYEYVDEYCAGCSNHSGTIGSTHESYTLKKSVSHPIQYPSNKIMKAFPNKETVIFSNNLDNVIWRIVSMGINILVSEEYIDSLIGSAGCHEAHPCMVLNRNDLMQLMKNNNEYYLSGTICVVYPDDNALEYVRTVNKLKKAFHNIKLVHVLTHNIYIDSSQKLYTDYLDAPIMSYDFE